MNTLFIRKLFVIAVLHCSVMTVLGVICGIGALGVGFSDSKQAHFWWDLVFWSWTMLDFPCTLVLFYSASHPDSMWIFGLAQALTSVIWALAVIYLTGYLSNSRKRNNGVQTT